MLVCKACGGKQASGKFCGKCGSPELEKVEEVLPEYTDVLEEEPRLDTSEKEDEEKQDEKIEPIEESVIMPDNVELVISNEAELEDVTEELDEEVEQQTQAEIGRRIQAEVDARVAAQLAASKEKERKEAANEKVNEVKEKTSQYGHYFLDVLTNPTRALGFRDDKFKYSLINIALYSLFLGLFAYRLLIMGTGGMFAPPFIQTIVPVMFVSLIMLAVAMLATFLMAQLTFDRPSIKHVLTQYGSLLIPVIALQLTSLLFTFVGLSVIAGILMAILAIFTFIIIPFQLVNDYEADREAVGQRIYINLFTVMLVVLAIAIVSIMMTVTVGFGIMEIFGDTLNDSLNW